LQALDQVEAKFNEYAIEQRTLADRLLQVEQKSTAPFERATKATGLGDAFVKQFEENKSLFEKTRSVRLEIKAAGDAITTASGRTIIGGGVGAIAGGVLGLQNALIARPAPNTSAVEYSRYTGQQGAAAQQAVEGDAKAAVRPDHSLIVQSALTIAGYAKMSRQAMSDSAELKRARCRGNPEPFSWYCIGCGTCQRCNGLSLVVMRHWQRPAHHWFIPHWLTLSAKAWQPCKTAGFNPDVVSLNPSDWLSIVVA
jgi:hypothetical protein